MERERLVSVIGARASKYVTLKKPSELIPFKGKFPLLRPYQRIAYFDAIRSTERLEGLSEEFQDITVKGNNIALLEEGFVEYLRAYNITPNQFKELSNSAKSDKLISWMERDCIDFSQLTIK